MVILRPITLDEFLDFSDWQVNVVLEFLDMIGVLDRCITQVNGWAFKLFFEERNLISVDAVKMLRTGADSRRIIVSAWNAAKIDEAALPPCHSFIQFTSYDNFDGGPRDLVCNLYMR
jgi:hypothetical protein